MLITFRNTMINNPQTKITNPLEYLLSDKQTGFEIIYALSNNEFITTRVNKVNEKYIHNFNTYLLPHLTVLFDEINKFLIKYPNFTDHKEDFYSEFKVKKRKLDEHGNVRWRKLVNPMPELKQLQRKICDTLKRCSVLPHNAAHGFVENRDFYTNAALHRCSNHIINLDLKDFFDNIKADLLKQKLKLHPIFNVIPEYTDVLLDNIVNIATYKGSTPQGSPLSPYLSNIFLQEFDYELRQALNDTGTAIIYTRYADDMSFSSKRSLDISNIIHIVENILHNYYNDELKINYNKTKKIVPGQCFITGVKLNQEHNLTIGWKKKQEIKGRIHTLAKLIEAGDLCIDDLIEKALAVKGYLAFINRVEPDYYQNLQTKYTNEMHSIDVFLRANYY